MIEHEDLRSDKTIIIGFAGPIGTGCSTLSKFVADNDQFIHMIETLGFIGCSANTNISLNTNILDDEVKNLFVKKQVVDKKIIELKNEIKNDLVNIKLKNDLLDSKNYAKAIHRKIKKLLEQRNYIYSLKYLFDEDYYQKKLRISCSSIIIFELIRQISNKKEFKCNLNILNFVKKLKNILAKHNVEQQKFTETYKRVKSLQEHEFKLKDIPENLVHYCFDKIKLIKIDLSELEEYRSEMQSFGDNLRSTGNPYMPADQAWIENNKDEFQKNNNIIGRYIDYLVQYESIANKNRLFLIDSLRNPMEVKYLRNRYSRFYLISIYSPKRERINRVKKVLGSAFNLDRFYEQDKRDQGRTHLNYFDGFYKQNVRDTVLLSDISINNEETFEYDLSGEIERHRSNIFLKLLRYISLILDPGCTKPTNEEMFMNMAYTMAMKSNCISRKVGAVIEGSKGYLIGAGWNDVGEGQISCGLRKIKDLRMAEYSPYLSAIKSKKEESNLNDEEVLNSIIEYYGDENCCFCLKDELSKAEIFTKITKASKDKIINEDSIDKLINYVKIKRLEYCKALHAEENAILQSAKIGGMGLKDSKMYVTTHPCELCAKKIQQAGISEVIYVEPYPKALSKELYLHDGVKKVDIRQFEGVKAYSYMRLFQQYIDIKERQRYQNNKFSII